MIRFRNILWRVGIGGLLLSVLVSCQTEPGQAYLDRGGLMIEALDSTQTDPNRYTADNVVYPAGKEQQFAYYYVKEQDTFLFRNRPRKEGETMGNSWEFVPLKESVGDPIVITQVEMEVMEGFAGMDRHIPNFTQSVIRYTLIPKYAAPKTPKVYAKTGLIENPRNIWMRPPRMSMFRILEMSPYPYIKMPPKPGQKWNWTRPVKDFWADPRWKVWLGTHTWEYEYEVAGATQWQGLECVEVRSRGTSPIGATELSALFHPEKGFVRCEYTNIDTSRVIMEIIQ